MTTEQLITYFNENEDDIMAVIPYPFPDDFKAVITQFYLDKVDALISGNFPAK